MPPDCLRSIDLVLRGHVVPVRGFLKANELDFKFHFLALWHFLLPALASEQCYDLLNTFSFLDPQPSVICRSPILPRASRNACNFDVCGVMTILADALCSDTELHGTPEDDENAQKLILEREDAAEQIRLPDMSVALPGDDIRLTKA